MGREHDGKADGQQRLEDIQRNVKRALDTVSGAAFIGSSS